MSTGKATLEGLRRYTACDISDALLKLDPKSTSTSSGERADPGAKIDRVLAGFLDGVSPLPRLRPSGSNIVDTLPTIGRAFTVKFISKSDPPSSSQPNNIPSGAQWSDLVDQDSIVVVEQPEGQRNAAVGGIHALRMEVRGVKGLLVGGRVRDLGEMRGLEMPVWSQSTSTVGAGAECKPNAIQVPIKIGDLQIEPNDIIFLDPIEGAVCIPASILDNVLDHLEARAEPEDKIKEMVRGGESVAEAFARWR